MNETKLFKMNTFICMYIYIHVDMHRIHALYFATPIIHIHKYMQGIYIYILSILPDLDSVQTKKACNSKS